MATGLLVMTTGLVSVVRMLTTLPTQRRARRRPDLSVFDDVAMLSGYDDRALEPLARHADRLTLRPGTELARQGGRSHQVVVLLSGEVVASRDGREVGRFAPGAVIGAAEELAGTAHAHTLVTSADAAVLVLAGPAYRWAASTLPGLAPRSVAGHLAQALAGVVRRR